ncbi:unnamed protein product [Cochlearia groenlandica]
MVKEHKALLANTKPVIGGKSGAALRRSASKKYYSMGEYVKLRSSSDATTKGSNTRRVRIILSLATTKDSHGGTSYQHHLDYIYEDFSSRSSS